MCKYCNKQELEGMPPFLPNEDGEDNENISALVYFNGDLDIWVYMNNDFIDQATFRINYCPMCGRKLSRVALDEIQKGRNS